MRRPLRAKAAYDRMRARGVDFTQKPIDRYGTVDAGFRGPSGNRWKITRASVFDRSTAGLAAIF